MDCDFDDIEHENKMEIDLINLEYVKDQDEKNIVISLDERLVKNEYNHIKISKNKVLDATFVKVVDIKEKPIDTEIKDDNHVANTTGLENEVVKRQSDIKLEDVKEEPRIIEKVDVKMEDVKEEPRNIENVFDVKLEDVKEEPKNIENDIDVKLEDVTEEPSEVDVNFSDEMALDDNNFYCDMCGEKYEDHCSKCSTLTHILNNCVSPTLANWKMKTVPTDILEIRENSIENGVFALKTLPKNVIFGPFQGVSRMENTKGYIWKIKNGKLVTVSNSNWMQYVASTSSTILKNLDIFQFEGNLFYRTNKEINESEELLVYYNDEMIKKFKNGEEGYYTPVAEDNSQTVFACTYCCLGFRLEKCLIEHKTKCPHAVSNIVDEIIQCHYCNIRLQKQEYLRSHVDNCQENFPRKCTFPMPANHFKIDTAVQIEGKTYGNHKNIASNNVHANDTGIIKIELKLHGKITKYLKCVHCSYITYLKTNLQVHIKNKHSLGTEKDFKCADCSYMTNFKSSLQRHIKNKHSDGIEKDFKCQYCSYETNMKANLQSHIKDRHSDGIEKDYKCRWCSYETNLKRSLQSHIKNKHTDGIEKDFKCAHCSFETKGKAYLQLHIKNKHSDGIEKDFKCKCCSFETNMKSYFQNHIKKNRCGLYEKNIISNST